MRLISAKIIDGTHLELSEPIVAEPGATIEISIPDDGDEMREWRELARRHALTAYADEDSVYDELLVRRRHLSAVPSVRTTRQETTTRGGRP